MPDRDEWRVLLIMLAASVVVFGGWFLYWAILDMQWQVP